VSFFDATAVKHVSSLSVVVVVAAAAAAIAVWEEENLYNITTLSF